MQHYPIYQPESEAMIQQFMKTRRYCLLITLCPSVPLQTGMFNPLVEDSKIFLHLHRQDPQLKQLRQNPHAVIVFTDFHGYIPSYAKDPDNASYATMFYRFVEVQASMRCITDSLEAAAILDRMMQQYQPEGGYRPFAAHLDYYDDSLKMIDVLEFTILSRRCKWKLGQNRNPQEQLLAHSWKS